MSSRCVAGTSLALGAPLISTNEHRKKSTPFCSTTFATSATCIRVLSATPQVLAWGIQGNLALVCFAQMKRA
jgi:hypothetical protein